MELDEGCDRGAGRQRWHLRGDASGIRRCQWYYDHVRAPERRGHVCLPEGIYRISGG